jgi:divalent metal cation (Fe/Co/Zn/Cd) transporter
MGPHRWRFAVPVGGLHHGSGCLIAILSMQYLPRRKIAIAEKIGSHALRADAIEAATCGWLSFVVVVTLAAQWLVRAW